MEIWNVTSSCALNGNFTSISNQIGYHINLGPFYKLSLFVGNGFVQDITITNKLKCFSDAFAKALNDNVTYKNRCKHTRFNSQHRVR